MPDLYKAPKIDVSLQTTVVPTKKLSERPSSKSPSEPEPQKCPEGEVLNVMGQCVEAEIIRNLFVFGTPKNEVPETTKPPLPKPKIKFNILFVKTPEKDEGKDPIIVPPPREKTLVYVLNKNSEVEDQEIIQVPSDPQKPEVYYVNYNEGENPTLPGGIDLNQALASTPTEQGQMIPVETEREPENRPNNSKRQTAIYRAMARYGTVNKF